MGPAWTAASPLPGGDFPRAGLVGIAEDLQRGCAGLPPDTACRLARSYGTLAATVLGGAATIDGLGQQFGAGLYESEVRYLMTREWARCAEDVLWRRTKLGLRLDRGGAAALERWMAEASGQATVPDARSAGDIA